jgi:hypothetical protein
MEIKINKKKKALVTGGTGIRCWLDNQTIGCRQE